MQVTGSNNTSLSTSRLSIRIAGGQSLHSEELDALAKAKRVELTLCGPVVATYPKELAEEIDFAAMLLTHGITPNEESAIIHFGDSRSVGYVALISKSLEKVILAERAAGKDITITTPLEACVKRAVVATKRAKNIYLHIEDDMAYVAYAENMRLHYAEVVPTAKESELINLLALLNKDFDLKKAQFTLTGKDGKRYYKCLKRYFRRVELVK